MKQPLCIVLVGIVGHVLSIAQPAAITFTQHVAPIIYRNCTPCHVDGGPGPFPLVTYSQVSAKASMIAMVTQDRYMPPQRNDPTYRSFAHERRLTDSDIQTIRSWVQSGKKEGAQRFLPKPPTTQANRSIHGKPHITLSMPSAVPIPGNNQQTYVCYAIPFELDKEYQARGIEYVPSNRKLAHHASYQILEVAPDVMLDSIPRYFFYEPGRRVVDDVDYNYFKLISPTYGPPIETFHGGWLPGSSPWVYPDGIGFRLPRRGVLMLRNLHYAPTPVPSSDSVTVHIYLGKKESRTVTFAAFRPAIGVADTVIRANSVDTHRIYVRIPQDISLLNINPHMHRLGRSFTVWAETPSKDTIKLCRIPDWDFDWQDFYLFKNPVHIPAGSVLNAIAIFDNTPANPNNPFYPPRDAPFEVGMDDTNEMMRLVLLALEYRKGDEKIRLE